jgi:CRISPR system Cascade subunit CasA
MPSFDLIDQPWVPVRWLAGLSGPAEVGLGELFARAHEIADITLPVPPAASGLWRILYLIAARITGLGNCDDFDGLAEWKRERRRVLAAGQFEAAAVARYFAAHADAFDLFDVRRPWLQDARLAAECTKSSGVNKLVIGRATGNNLVWLSHHCDLAPQPVRAAEAAWYLLAWMYYGPSGKITARTVAGRTESNMTAGPLRSRISFHPLGENLYESLITGIPYPSGDHARRNDPDLAPWEDKADSDPLGLPPARQGLSGALTGQFRHALLLTPSPDGTQVTDTRITWAWRQPHALVEDPYLIYDTSRASAVPYARYAKRDRAVWRDLDALLLKETGSGRTRRPAVFDSLLDRSIGELIGRLRVRAYGFDQEGQTIDYQWFTATTPPVLSVRDASDLDLAFEHDTEIGTAHEAAERVAGDLKKALQRAWAALSDPQDGQGKGRGTTPDGPWLTPGLSRYWAAAEDAFWSMTRDPEKFSFPSNTFIRLAFAAYDEVTDQYARRGPRVARALERARGGIAATWSRHQPLLPLGESDA